MLSNTSPQPAAGNKLFAGKPRRIVRSQEDRDRCDILRLTDAAKRSLSYDGIHKVSADEICGAFGFDTARIQRVDTDLPGAEFPCEHAGDDIDGSFGSGVNRSVWRRQATDARTNIDD